VPRFGYMAACVASPTAWIFACVFLLPAYAVVMRRLRGTLAQPPAAQPQRDRRAA
jgi:uncharacterized membrane protein YhaH (DUF805 family)